MLLGIGRRLLSIIPAGIIVTALLFFSINGLIGSPAALMLGNDATPSAVAQLNKQLGFDRPILEQYLDWMERALTGDFGRSYTTHQTVAEAIIPRLPVTFEIGVAAIVIATVAAVLFSSITTGQAVVRPLATGLAIIGITVPNFILGLGLIYLFSIQLAWLPSIGWIPWSAGVGTHIAHVLLPILTLSAYYYGVFTLVYQAEYDAIRRRLFVRVVKAKGLTERQVSFRHVLPNSILPVITYVGLSLGQLMGGAVVTESLFSIPGIGGLLVDSIVSRDFPVMLAIGMIVVITVVIMSTAADVLYSLANPQIRVD
jgi:peptide/nickel transport system permease protein